MRPGNWSFWFSALLSFKTQMFCALRISESSKADCCKANNNNNNNKNLVHFQIHPSPKLISLPVIAGINFLASQSYPGRRRAFWKKHSRPWRKVSSGKIGAGKTLYFVLKNKGGILVKSLVFRLFLLFFIQIYIRRQNCRGILLK